MTDIKFFDNYLQSISTKFSHEETSEMGYRADFELLINGIFESIKGKRILHDARSQQGNKPDFIVLNHDVPILYIEAKDIGISLDKVEKSEQMARYFGYANLVLTDYTEFRFYRNGISYGEPIKIAHYDLKSRTVTPVPENYELAAKTLIDFTESNKEPIKSGNHLAKIMGGKAQRIRDNVRHFLAQESEQNLEIMRVYEALKKMLVHDLTLEAFSDMYAQTLVYGLFVARYYDESPDTFTRQEARDLVPASNPFLQHFFDHIAGPNFDKRLSYIVDELCTVFQHSDTKALIEEYMGDADPVIHFYEDFLKEYDPELRKKMGAYYTPLPVVRFIVRSVDHILEKEFNLPNGLADTSKLPSEQHRVQILDPAVGTGTFISATIRSIYERLKKQGQEGRWPAYVHNDLLPRLHGFELMMAPYTIAHLKLSLAFKQTGFWKFHRRLGIYLTNSLEQSEAQQSITSFGFAESIAEEAKEADKIKNETPIMVVIGNPPYSGVSSNETESANNLVKKYKIEPGGKQKLQERKHWLNDDYVKFIALAEEMVTKRGEGIIGFITNNGYLDNPTFRGMRWHLMNTFDSIYIIDLHGNSKKKETAPDGTKDENVFDIQQGVSIILAIKTSKKEKNNLAKIYRTDLYGKRDVKYKSLDSLSIQEVEKIPIRPNKPNFFFVQEGSLELKNAYQKGFAIQDLFPLQSMGITSARDNIVIDFTQNKILERIKYMTNPENTDDQVRLYLFPNKKEAKYKAGDTRGWKLSDARKKIVNEVHLENLKKISYRPFDIREIYYHPDMVDWGREKIMQHFLKGPNLGFCSAKLGRDVNAHNFYVTNHITDKSITSSLDNSNIFPLYLYSEDGEKRPNLKKEIVDNIEKTTGKVSPEDIFDYIYAVLYSPSYREKYKEFLKIDFPRVPYPKDTESFKKLVTLGTELRALHLLESPKVHQLITTYPVAGSDMVEKISYKDGKVLINDEQYFGNVPEVAWKFYIGGYQPAQKWLKDRKGRTLTNEDIEHYQEMIVALSETGKTMEEIDKIFKSL